MTSRWRFAAFGPVAIYAAMLFGLFLAMLDLQITNAILPTLGRDLGASADQLGVIQTAYLSAEIITIALARSLVARVSARTAFAAASLCFAFASLCCAICSSIPLFLASRFFQGLSAGVLIPIAFQVRFRLFGADKQVVLGSIVTMVLTCAPTFGPSIGAWITELMSWRVIFLINVPGALLVSLVVLSGTAIDQDGEITGRPFPWVTALYLAICLTTFHVLLEKFIRDRAVLSGVGLYWVIILFMSLGMFVLSNNDRSLSVISFGLFRHQRFTMGIIFSSGLGLIHLTLGFLLPLYLQEVAQCSLKEVALIMLVGGLAQMTAAPLIWLFPRFLTHGRMVFFGLALLSSSLVLLTRINPEWGFNEMFLPQALRGLSFMFLAVPAQDMVMRSVGPESTGDASVLFNASRNLASMTGIAATSVYVQIAYERLIASGLVTSGYGWSPEASVTSAGGAIGSVALSLAYRNAITYLLCSILVMAGVTSYDFLRLRRRNIQI